MAKCDALWIPEQKAGKTILVFNKSGSAEEGTSERYPTVKHRFLLAGMVIVVCGVCSSVFAADATLLAISGRKMTAEQAASIEKQVAQNPDDVDSRTQLLGYYFGKQFQDPAVRIAKQKNILWLIENAPAAGILRSPFGQLDAILDGAAYTQGKQAWEKQLKQDPQNLKLLENSANYFLIHDRDLAKVSLQQAQALDGKNPQWPAALGQLYLLEMMTNSLQPQSEVASQALAQLEIAYNLSTERAQENLLQYLAKAAFAAKQPEKATAYAEKMLSLDGNGWNAGNNQHQGNIILGKLALAAGNVEEAKQRLLKAGKTSGSPQLNSFGPDMTLAKALLQQDEKEVVLEYLVLCSKFWTLGKTRLDQWTEIVKNDQIPSDWR
tara:strand:+ start:1385 stop:2524 length:1140 start_codon:yes stop_codon:yes gene_type:complete